MAVELRLFKKKNMGKKLLHIINGDGLTEKLDQLHISGEIIIWREMLCEGPTSYEIGNEEFIAQRQDFFRKGYGVSNEEYRENFLAELEKLEKINDFDEIILWFEFDLYSHINMMAVISFLSQKNKNFPLFLVCSGRVQGEKNLIPLADLSAKQLQEHYDYKIRLNEDDLGMAILIWEIYCGNKPSRLLSEIKKTTNFTYLPSCLRAHIERFPNAQTGLNSLETNILKLIRKHKITSENQLLGYSIEYQGYYGYELKQMQRVLKKVSSFYELNSEGIQLNDQGVQAINSEKNFYRQLKDEESYGGVKKYDFLYDPETHNLLKL